MAQPHAAGPRRAAALFLPTASRQSLDARLYTAVNSLPHRPGGDQYIELLSDLGKGAGWVAGGIWLVLRDGPRGRRAGVAAVAAMFTAVAVVQGPLKRVFRRTRPFKRRLAFVVGPEPVDSSFPSGHTAGSFAAATALAAAYPRDRPILIGLAAAVGISRVYLGHHFPSDVLAGAGIGTLIGLAFSRLLGNRVRERGDDPAGPGGGAAHGHPARAARGPRRAVPHRRRLLV